MTRNIGRRHALALMAGATAAVTLPVRAQDPKKIAFLLNGTPGNTGWNFEHLRGIALAKLAYGDAVQIETFTNVGEMGKGDTEKLSQLASAGYDLVFATSPGYGQALTQVVLAAPNTRFEHCGGFVRTTNLATYSARWYEARMPQGLIAGAITRTNRIGYIAPFQTPQVIRGINAAYLAAKSVNPNVAFDVIWLNSWLSPDIEDAAARLLARGGADVLMSDAQSTQPIQVAQELGIHAFGQGSEMTRFGPDASLPATINNWGPYYVSRIAALLEDRWDSRDTWGGFAEDMIQLGPIGPNVPAPAASAARRAVASMRDKQGGPFVGPIRKQDGSFWLKDGATPTDLQLQEMSFFVNGLTRVTG